MDPVDAEAVLADLKARLADGLEQGQTSFGTRDLLGTIGELEGRYRLDQDAYDRFLRRFMRNFHDTFFNVAGSFAAAEAGDDAVTRDAEAERPADVERGADSPPRSQHDSEEQRWQSRPPSSSGNGTERARTTESPTAAAGPPS